MCDCFNFSAYIRFSRRVLIETNVNISNEPTFLKLSKCKQHWVASKVYMNSFEVHLHANQSCLLFDKPQENEIHYLQSYCTISLLFLEIFLLTDIYEKNRLLKTPFQNSNPNCYY